jgi:hypothetical protein
MPARIQQLRKERSSDDKTLPHRRDRAGAPVLYLSHNASCDGKSAYNTLLHSETKHPMLAHMPTDLPTAIPFVADDPVGSMLGATAPVPPYRPACHEVWKNDRLVALARRQDQGEQCTTPSARRRTLIPKPSWLRPNADGMDRALCTARTQCGIVAA